MDFTPTTGTREVRDDDLYDLASITKVSGALPGLMKLNEEGRFDLDATLGTYLKYFRRGNKKNLTFREILAHQAGLMPWIPYWQTAIRKNGKYRWKTLKNTQSENYPFEIAENLYLHKSYKKKIYRQIRKTDLGEKKYLYSGLTFYIFPEIIEEITGEKYEEYIYDNFYKPLGANTLTYRPMEKFDVDRIVPTEYDSLFRKTQIHGKVHDEGAAMMEGISSNAGLFANANDLAKLWQMYCNYGEYGGQQYLQEETVREFARCQYPENDNRRALGFDRPLPAPKPDGNTAVSASQSSFGHTGFTGTFAWADPAHNLVYIFLSNRVYPTRSNTKLYDLNIRTNIQQVIYDAME
jgi:beta-N-acetylhexosaminidase